MMPANPDKGQTGCGLLFFRSHLGNCTIVCHVVSPLSCSFSFLQAARRNNSVWELFADQSFLQVLHGFEVLASAFRCSAVGSPRIPLGETEVMPSVSICVMSWGVRLPIQPFLPAPYRQAPGFSAASGMSQSRRSGCRTFRGADLPPVHRLR